jgi:SAM-dependent methyltransferase
MAEQRLPPSTIRRFYDLTATDYARDIAPVFALLAADFARWALACASLHRRGALVDPFDLEDSVDYSALKPDGLKAWNLLDVGTGTGALAAQFAGHAAPVLGVDLSAHMLRAGNVPNAVQADAHHLPFARRAFHLVTSSFGLNLCVPRPALASIARVLRPGGLFIFQEWASLDAPGRVFDEIFARYTPATLPDDDGPIRDMLERDSPWTARLQDADDYYDILKSAGFALVWAHESAFATVRLESLETFLASKFAWPWRRLILAALDPAARAALMDELQAALAPFTHADGSFNWSPPLFRVCAVR